MEGDIIIKKEKVGSNHEVVTASIKLDITYTIKSDDELQFIRIFTDNNGGGNYFRIETGLGEDSEEPNDSTFPFNKFEDLLFIINDFKSRYNKLKENG